MRYPTLSEIGQSRSMISQFGGYNHNPVIQDNEFFDMKNMSADGYPLLTPRKKRGIYASPANATGMIAKDTLCYVDGSKLVFDGYQIEMGLSDEKKQLISMGAYIIIMPDKKYFNTADVTDYGNIEASFTTSGTVSFELCRVDGSAYGQPVISDKEPESPDDQALWIDTSETVHILKQWSAQSAMWVEINTTYVKMSCTGIGAAFSQYDGVNMSGITVESLAALNGSTVVWEKGDDYLVVTGLIDYVQTQDEPITVSRSMPNMDYITESGNRLWGCHYGVATNGEVVNELYACKLGDFRNWSCYMGVSTDSYTVSLGTDGVFTGAITHLGYPLFFKEGYLHKVYGSIPAEFQVQTTACKGVERGSHDSLAIVNSILYYNGTNGICYYDGSLPSEVTKCFGDIHYHNAVGESHRNRYYVDMQDDVGTWHMLALDTTSGLWHKEDNIHTTAMCSCRGELYMIDADDGRIKTAEGSGATAAENTVPWMVETGIIGLASPDNKYLSRLNIRLQMVLGSQFVVEAQYDSTGKWERLFYMIGKQTKSFTVPVRPKRCDHMKLRFSGIGDVRIFSIAKTMEDGSDMR